MIIEKKDLTELKKIGKQNCISKIGKSVLLKYADNAVSSIEEDKNGIRYSLMTSSPEWEKDHKKENEENQEWEYFADCFITWEGLVLEE